MPPLRFILLFGAMAVGLVTTAGAEGDETEGEKIARQWCVRCHNVEAGGPFKQFPPSFASIAVYRSDDQIRGRILFPPLHSSMPQIGYMLTPDNVDHVIAYITSLEQQ